MSDPGTQRETRRVGFVGLGRMGTAIAGRVLHGGHDLVAHNRTPGSAGAAELEGARAPMWGRNGEKCTVLLNGEGVLYRRRRPWRARRAGATRLHVTIGGPDC